MSGRRLRDRWLSPLLVPWAPSATERVGHGGMFARRGSGVSSGAYLKKSRGCCVAASRVRRSAC